LNIPIEQPVEIVPLAFVLPVPATDLDEAVRLAMLYRLDLQTQRDRVEDAMRVVGVARNELLPDLDLTGSWTVATDRSRARQRLNFEPDDSLYTAGVTLGLPLKREAERRRLREAEIQYERRVRDFDLLRDTVAVNVRATVRDIDLARFSLTIQDRNIAIGEQRKASIEAAPDRATARDASDTVDELLAAKDARDEAARDLQVAILRYLIETGQLRVDRQGAILPLRGMAVHGAPPSS